MTQTLTHILVTGSRGFIGKNAVVRLGEIDGLRLSRFDRGYDPAQLPALLAEVDAVLHLAGENRPEDPRDFDEVNAGLTATICAAIRHENAMKGRQVPLILASTIQADRDTPYGRSKRAGEMAVEALAAETGNPCTIFRLTGVFGKWCRPNYNSVVATFCNNIAHGLPIRIDDPTAAVRLVYVDDVLDAMIACLKAPKPGLHSGAVAPEYLVTLHDLAEQLQRFASDRASLSIDRVGTGWTRALYATYLSYLPTECFAYDVPVHGDARGVFVEMLKTRDSGQFSYFTAHPGITRGGHYHHTKSEKFLVLRGTASFRFRHLQSGELLEIRTTGDRPQVVETIPGWSHDVTNSGTDELIVMLWANEVFDRERPDTIASKV